MYMYDVTDLLSIESHMINSLKDEMAHNINDMDETRTFIELKVECVYPEWKNAKNVCHCI